MTYNRFLYNTSLYNAVREEAPALARSIIQAHTGPHIQAVVAGEGGTSFVSDFTITEGAVVKPPTQFKFPDLGAFIRAYRTQAPKEDFLTTDFLNATIFVFGIKNLPACVFIVDKIPDLSATVFGLLQSDLPASITGKLGMKDLPAILQVTVANLAAQMSGIAAPSFFASIFAQEPGNLGAKIHAPLDLPAFLQSVKFGDLPADIRGFQVSDLPANMLGIPAPQFSALIRGFAGDIKDMFATAVPLAFNTGLPATINPSLSGETGFKVGLPANIAGTGGFKDTQGIIKSVTETTGTLGALIKTGGDLDLPAIINFLGAGNLKGILESIPLGERDRFLNAVLQPLMSSDLGAVMTFNENVSFLAAQIFALHGTDDLGAFIRVAETFVTALLTVTTLASRSLRATIGKPGCAGGSGNSVLGAFATAQHKGDLGALLQSFLQKNLGGAINTEDVFFAFDTIDVIFTPFKLPGNLNFRATDTIPVLFSPFRGRNLGALLTPIQNNVFLPAAITAVFPLPKVVPAINRITAADLRVGENLDIQEIRLQLEGALFEYIYVNGTDQTFIKDPNEDWKINIRSFKPIAAGLFGDHAAAKICRLGSLVDFSTIDEAVRFCIQAVLGFEEEVDLGAAITATGSLENLAAFLEIQNNFRNLNASASRVFPSDLGAQVGVNAVTNLNLMAFIHPNTVEAVSGLGATIDDIRQGDLGAEITGL